MSQIKEIRNKISSIKKTQKITRAMELVAASKMRKAQERMLISKPYALKIRKVISHVASSQSEYHHPYLEEKKTIQRVGYIIITSDRGLCGSLNIGLLRKVLTEMRDWEKKEIGIDLCLIGRKGKIFFQRFGGHILGLTENLGDTPKVENLIGVVKTMLNHYDQGKLDAIYIASNEFVNTMSQKPTIRQLLPLQENEQESQGRWDYIYEPDSAQVILEKLLIRYIESQVYQAVIENLACFQAAQMVAMKNATENAGEIISELQLIYNKARQAGITREIAEIVAGAAAVD